LTIWLLLGAVAEVKVVLVQAVYSLDMRVSL
jgi:hypothetical protein